ncbi:hypothetical protein OZX61_02245 [Acinetobacter sp. ESL0695]|uniref:hypothetical protein n=1 Tax=Acinetobacter sp. ESL0695 TaxID=2983215 RepID=UPI0023F1BA1A|nr:hypothetical protein [Acinetobacter sp. ESL0695]WEV49330.1 hypothetical protein OZX61_02245 [Acinetobacter sp. ESL0695]
MLEATEEAYVQDLKAQGLNNKEVNEHVSQLILPKDLQQKDASDLQAAQRRDSDAMIQNAEKLAPKHVGKLKNAFDTLNCKTNQDYDKFLKDILYRSQK